MANDYVTIKCPQSIERLCEFGESTARVSDWGNKRAKEAMIGLWLSAQIARASLRGTVEVVGDRLQVDPRGELTGDAKRIDDYLVAAWAPLEEAAKADPEPSQDTTIELTLPSDAGAWPAVAAVAIAAVAGAYFVSKWSANMAVVFDRFVTNAAEAAQSWADCQIVIEMSRGLATVQAELVKAGKDPNTAHLDQAQVDYLKASEERRKISTINRTTPLPLDNKGPLDDFDLGLGSVGTLAALGLGAYLLLQKGR